MARSFAQSLTPTLALPGLKPLSPPCPCSCPPGWQQLTGANKWNLARAADINYINFGEDCMSGDGKVGVARHVLRQLICAFPHQQDMLKAWHLEGDATFLTFRCMCRRCPACRSCAPWEAGPRAPAARTRGAAPRQVRPSEFCAACTHLLRCNSNAPLGLPNHCRLPGRV